MGDKAGLEAGDRLIRVEGNWLDLDPLDLASGRSSGGTASFGLGSELGRWNAAQGHASTALKKQRPGTPKIPTFASCARE